MWRLPNLMRPMKSLRLSWAFTIWYPSWEACTMILEIKWQLSTLKIRMSAAKLILLDVAGSLVKRIKWLAMLSDTRKARNHKTTSKSVVTGMRMSHWKIWQITHQKLCSKRHLIPRSGTGCMEPPNSISKQITSPRDCTRWLGQLTLAGDQTNALLKTVTSNLHKNKRRGLKTVNVLIGNITRRSGTSTRQGISILNWMRGTTKSTGYTTISTLRRTARNKNGKVALIFSEKNTLKRWLPTYRSEMVGEK